VAAEDGVGALEAAREGREVSLDQGRVPHAQVAQHQQRVRRHRG